MNKITLISKLKWRILVWIILAIVSGLAFFYGHQYGINQRIIILITLVLGTFTQLFSGITSLVAIISMSISIYIVCLLFVAGLNTQKILQYFNYNLPPYIEKPTSENFASNDCDLDFVRALLIVHNQVVYGDRLLDVEFTSKLSKDGNIDYYILYATRSGGSNMEFKKTNCF